MSVLLKCSGMSREFYLAILFLIVGACVPVFGVFIRSENHLLAAWLSCPTFPMEWIYMKWKKLRPTLGPCVGTNPWEPCTSLYWGKRRFQCESQTFKEVFFLISFFLLCASVPQTPALLPFFFFHLPLRGCWRLMRAEAGGWGGCRRKGALEASRGIFAYHQRKWEGFLHLYRLQTTTTYTPLPFSLLPASIINCAAAAGEKDGESGVTPWYLTYHLL